MRLLFIAKDFPAPEQPRSGVFVLRQAQALARLGHEIRVVRVVPRAPAWTAKWRAYRAVPDRYAIEGIGVETIRALFPPRMLAMEHLWLQVGPALRRSIAAFQPHIVHAHFLIPSGQLAVRQALPTVVTAHGSDAYDWAWRRPGLRRAAAEAVSRASLVVAVSAYIADHVRALARREVHVVYNGADEGVFKPADREAARVELGLPPERFVIAFTGGAAQAKGVFDLLQAAAALSDLRPLLLVAGLDPRDSLDAAIAARGVETRTYGVLAQADLARLLTAADVFALPSYREGLPASLCEAMLCGRPAVATPAGGIPEILRDGEAGYLVAPGAVDALSARLRAIARDPAEAARMGDAALRFARDHLTWRINADRYDALYRDMLPAA
ncbi:MAG: glycosyltransferase [Candidatus Baltobacteraceae bacterium]